MYMQCPKLEYMYIQLYIHVQCIYYVHLCTLFPAVSIVKDLHMYIIMHFNVEIIN